MKAFLQAPTAPPRPVGRPVPSETTMSASSTLPEHSLAMSTAMLMGHSWGISPDSKPTISSAVLPSSPALLPARSGSSRRKLAGHSLVWTMRRAASYPRSQEGKVTPAVARYLGRSWTLIHASVMIPRMPSLPRARRSGLGPAPLPGRRLDSHQPAGVSIRTDSTMSSM